MRLRIKNLLVFAFLCTLCAVSTVEAQSGGKINPFTKQTNPTASTSSTIASESLPVEEPGLGAQIMARMVEVQRGLHATIAELVRRVQPGNAGFDVLSLLSLLGISFLYGIFHALGPGHGKAIASSFFLARPALIRHGFELGYWLAIIHAAVAIGLVYLLSSVLKLGFGSGTAMFSWWLGTISYSMVVAIGLFMVLDVAVHLVTKGRVHLHFHLPLRKHAHSEHDHHGHNHDNESHNHEDHSHPPTTEAGTSDTLVKSRELFALGFLSAVVPCPGALGIMVFAAGVGAPLVGGLAVLALSLGMGITSSVAGIVGILIRRGVLKAGEKRMPNALRTVGALIRVVGSILFVLLGIALLVGQF